MYWNYHVVGVLILFFVSVKLFTQTTLTGTVKDAETGILLPSANIVVLNGKKTLNYAITNDKGTFSITLNESVDSLKIAVTMLGYTAYAEKIGTKRFFDFHLFAEPVELREVIIHRGRIFGRGDTIKYDASEFLRANDKTVEDLMKRLPGIDVDDDGNIRYKGKNIGNVYVEGLNMMDARYKAITKNLSAQAVKTVEVMDNHQRIKSLAGKIPSETPDINLRLKDNFKDKWNFSNKLTAGVSPERFLYEWETNAIQIAKRSQSLYGVKLSNTGNGITKETDISGFDNLLLLTDYQIFTDRTVTAPIKERRWLFDNAALVTANRLYKLSDDTQLRFNASLTHDNISQQRLATTTYYNPQKTQTVDEKTGQYLTKTGFQFSADLENNKNTRFFRNRFEMIGEDNKSSSNITGSYDLYQQLNTNFLSVKDNLSFTKQSGKGDVVKGQSIMGYWLRNQQLNFMNFHQPFPLHCFFFQGQAGIHIRRTKIAQDYTAGISTDFNSIKSNHRVWIAPDYEYYFGNLRVDMGMPLTLAYIPDEEKTLFLPEIKLRFNYKLNYAWNFWLSGKYEKTIGNVVDFYDKPYFSDYRTQIINTRGIPLNYAQSYGFRSEYKNTIKEFFFVTEWFLIRNRLNNTIEQQVNSDNIFQFIRHYISHGELSKGVNTMISKGFFDLHSKVSLETSYSENTSAQIRSGKIIPFSFQTLTFAPKMNVSPTPNTEIAYDTHMECVISSFGAIDSKTVLHNINHKMSLYFTKKKLTLSLSGEYFHNEIVENKYVTLTYLDFSAIYKIKSVSFSLSMNNLLNNKNYQYTLYNPLAVYTSQVSLRPREILLSVYVSL